ncbi:MAG: multifunctional CCA addition/repair protein [Pseudomonadota bacterium]|nr:multifunctional CCA addition/repair protein [Pseudomonadota bacterium]
MNVYLVGGAVRDKLLNLPVKDRDWVVVGATPDALLQQGYQSVGKDFPVFLHPTNHEEYALARTERKTAAGYTGFECHFGQEVTLEEDLSRRDLTINAMAEDDKGSIIDPYGGQQDLQNRVLRHVSHAFVEDPLRVLRVARFLARYDRLGFRIADDTLALMQQIAASGELQHLTPERVWVETEKALQEPSPWRYFEALRECNALAVVFPELDTLFGVPQPPQHHPEIDTGVHVMMTLQAALRLMTDRATPELNEQRIPILFSLLCHDLGKGLTPPEKLPSHPGHEDISEFLSKQVCARLRAPNPVKRLSRLVARYHTHCHRAFELKPSTVMRLFEALDLFRRGETLEGFLLACEADARGRTGFEDRNYHQVDYLRDCAQAARQVEAKELVHLGYKGETLGTELRKRRIDAIRNIKRSYLKDAE